MKHRDSERVSPIAICSRRGEISERNAAGCKKLILMLPNEYDRPSGGS
jgi:hypothetical protein